jgi:guanylate kinase
MIVRRGLCLVLAAPSGGGKSSIMRALLGAEPGLVLSISVTTREPRPGEQEGVDYYFRSAQEFDDLVRAGELLEWARVFGRGYGSPRAPVARALAEGRDVAFDIDWQGHRQLRAALPGDVVSAFLLPPSLAELEARLLQRAGEGAAEIARRMQAARSEMSHVDEFDHVIVNRDFATAVAEVRAVLHAARSATARLTGLAGFVAEMGKWDAGHDEPRRTRPQSRG